MTHETVDSQMHACMGWRHGAGEEGGWLWGGGRGGGEGKGGGVCGRVLTNVTIDALVAPATTLQPILQYI